MCQSCKQDIGIKDSDGDSCCNQQVPDLPVFPHGASEMGNEVREVCSDVISAVCRLKDIIDVSPDDVDEAYAVTCKYLDVMSNIADLTQAVLVYNEPDDGGEPN